jgi:hypothetical protein
LEVVGHNTKTIQVFNHLNLAAMRLHPTRSFSTPPLKKMKIRPWFQNSFLEKLLKLLITIVDTELFKTVQVKELWEN